MSEITEIFEPSACQGDKPTWKGQIVLRVPAWDETLEFTENNYEFMASSMEGKKKPDALVNMKLMRAMLVWSYQFYKKVDLERIADKKKVQSLDTLRRIKDGQQILQEVASKLVQGFELGNG